MKSFRCGDVVAGCTAQWDAATEEEILALVATHAREDHGLVEIAPELVAAVRAAIRPSAALA